MLTKTENGIQKREFTVGKILLKKSFMHQPDRANHQRLRNSSTDKAFDEKELDFISTDLALIKMIQPLRKNILRYRSPRSSYWKRRN